MPSEDIARSWPTGPVAMELAGCGLEVSRQIAAETITVRGIHSSSGTLYKKVFPVEHLWEHCGFDKFDKAEDMYNYILIAFTNDSSRLSPMKSQKTHSKGAGSVDYMGVRIQWASGDLPVKSDARPYWIMSDKRLLITIGHVSKNMVSEYRLELERATVGGLTTLTIEEGKQGSRASATESVAELQLRVANLAREKEAEIDQIIAELTEKAHETRVNMNLQVRHLERQIADAVYRQTEMKENADERERLLKADFARSFNKLKQELKKQIDEEKAAVDAEVIEILGSAAMASGSASGTASLMKLLVPEEPVLQMGVWTSTGVIVRGAVVYRRWNQTVTNVKSEEIVRFDKDRSRLIIVRKGVYQVYGYATLREKDYGWLSVYQNGSKLVGDAWVSSKDHWCSAHFDVTVKLMVGDFLEVREIDWAIHSRDRMANQLTVRRLPGTVDSDDEKDDDVIEE